MTLDLMDFESPLEADFCDIYLDVEVQGMSFAFFKISNDGSPYDIL